MSEILDRQRAIVDDFSLFEDWMSRYEYIIDLGKKLEPLDEKYKTRENLVEGCVSQAWIVADLRDGKLHYRGDGDAIITKGLLYLLLQVVNDLSPEEITDAQIDFVKDIGLTTHLSPSRTNGLIAMIQRIKEIANKYKN